MVDVSVDEVRGGLTSWLPWRRELDRPTKRAGCARACARRVPRRTLGARRVTVVACSSSVARRCSSSACNDGHVLARPRRCGRTTWSSCARWRRSSWSSIAIAVRRSSAGRPACAAVAARVRRLRLAVDGVVGRAGRDAASLLAARRAGRRRLVHRRPVLAARPDPDRRRGSVGPPSGRRSSRCSSGTISPGRRTAPMGSGRASTSTGTRSVSRCRSVCSRRSSSSGRRSAKGLVRTLAALPVRRCSG